MNKSASGIRSFPKNYWTAIVMEFFERGAYYGVLSVLSVYLVLSNEEGGLGFSREAAGAIMGTIPPLLYFLPLFAGALADRYGFRNMLMIAFSFLATGYFLTGFMHSYGLVFASLVIMAIGAGLFKPVISGTIAHATNEKNSTLGFGIFYWAINLGAFFFPLVLVPVLKRQSCSYVFWMAAAAGTILLLMNVFLYREPEHVREKVPLTKVFGDMALVFRDWKFILMILIYSGFWIMYFQMYGTVLWYVNEYMDMTPVNNAVNALITWITRAPSQWKFDVEHVTVINAGVIIVLQLFVSRIVNRFRALPTIITGITLGTAGMAILAFSANAWVFVTGCIVFTMGEMTAHPKFNSFVGLIAPAGKKGLYMGYSFFCSVIGSFVGGFIGAPLYNFFVDNQGRPDLLWLIFSGIGLTSVVGLIFFNRVAIHKEQRSS